MNNAPKDEVVDFSGYFKKNEQQITETSEIEPLEMNPKKPLRTTYWLIGILVLLAIIQTIIFFVNRHPSNTIPEGYRLIYPKNGPGRVEKIK